MKIAEFSVKHPVIITILLIAALLFGGISLFTMKQDLISQIDMPSVRIITIYPGASPKDIERDVTEPLEHQFSMVSGVDSIDSESANSVSVITIMFDWDENVDIRMNDIRDKINNAAASLPEGILGLPTVWKMSSNMVPILTMTVESGMDKKNLSDYIEDNISPRLNRISGIAMAVFRGTEEMIVDVCINPQRLAARGVSLLDVYKLLQYNNIVFPAGEAVFRGENLSIRTSGDFSSIDEIKNMVVGFSDETFIRLSDVADVSLVPARPELYADDGDGAIVSCDVMKQQGADTMAVIAEIKKLTSEIEKESGGIVKFETVGDTSGDIRLAVNSVKNSALLGALLAVVVIFIFLQNVRTTIIIGVSIPLSVVLAFIGMKLKGQSLNLMTLGGLTVAIGMMVDSSIVILENTYNHFLKSGDRKTASIKGASEVGGAVIASTSTSLAVFIPMMLIGGIAGAILSDASFTVVFALAAAMIVAIVVVPYMSALLLKMPKKEVSPAAGWFRNLFNRGFGRLEKAYRNALWASIRNRKFVLLLAVVLLVISVFTVKFLGFEFITVPDMNEFEMQIETPQGYTLEQTRAKLGEIAEVVDELVPELTGAVYYSGLEDSLGMTTCNNIGYARFRLAEHSQRSRSVFDIIHLLQRAVAERVPDVNVTVANGGISKLISLAVGGEGFMLEVYGNNFDDVLASAEMIRRILEQDPDVTKAELNVSTTGREMISNLSLQYMGNLGVTPYEAAVTSRILFNGMEAGQFRDGEDVYDIMLDSDLVGEEISEDVLNQLTVKSQSGKQISFANFTDLQVQNTVDKIPHRNKMKSVMVVGHMKGNDVGGLQARLVPKFEGLTFPEGVRWGVSGSAELMGKTFREMAFAMAIAVFLVYMVMVIQFETFTQPLIVMASVPFTFIGVVSSLIVFGSTLSVISFMGIISLAGMVVNNAIVLIDYMNLLRKRDGKELVRAVLDGGSSRLKPILMTTLTTILGIIPMSLGVGEGAEIYAPLGQAIGGGLVTSTLITLFLIPVLYYILESRKLKIVSILNKSSETDLTEAIDEEI